MPETEDFVDEEFLTDAEQSVEDVSSAEYEERETFESSGSETSNEAEPQEVIEPGRQAVLDQKGGEPSDWQLEYKGDSGYHFDGQEVRDPDGNVWTNEDTALHQEMVAQWKEGGSAIFFLPDYREQMEDREILYVTQLILSEKGDVTYEIHKHETIYPKEEELVEKDEQYAAALAELRLDTMEDFRETREIESAADTFMSIEATQGLGVNDSEPVEVADEISPEEIIPAVATESAESVADDPVAEISAMASNIENSEQNDAPDPWLVELLNFDALDPVEPHDNTIAEPDVPQEAIHEDTEALDEKFSEKVIADAMSDLEIVARESIVEQPISTMAIEEKVEATLVDTTVELSRPENVERGDEVPVASEESLTSSFLEADEVYAPVDAIVEIQEPLRDVIAMEPAAIQTEAAGNMDNDISETEIITNALEIPAVPDAIAEVVENQFVSEQSAPQAEQLETSNIVSEMEVIVHAADSPASAEILEPINAIVNPIEPALTEPVADIVVSESSQAQPEAGATKGTELTNDVEVSASAVVVSTETHVDPVSEKSDGLVPVENAIAEHSIAPEAVEIQNTPVVLHEVVDAEIQEPATIEPVADEHEYAQSMQLEVRSVNAKSAANDNEQPAPLQSAETILRALGIPLPISQTPRSPELVALKGLPGMPHGIPPSQQTRTGTNRFRTSVRSRSRDGVTLKMAA